MSRPCKADTDSVEVVCVRFSLVGANSFLTLLATEQVPSVFNGVCAEMSTRDTGTAHAPRTSSSETDSGIAVARTPTARGQPQSAMHSPLPRPVQELQQKTIE